MNNSKNKTVKRIVSVDSLFRLDYNNTESTDFVYRLPVPINKVTSIKLTSIEFFNSWYTFSAANQSNVFTITIYNCPTPIDITDITYDSVLTNTIVIPEGNYRSDIFLSTINNMFSNMRNGLEYLYFEINEVDTKCIFRTKLMGDDPTDLFLNDDLPSDFYFTIDFAIPGNPIYKTAGWMLGFKNPSYTANRTTTVLTDSAQFQTKTYNWYLKGESSYGNSMQNYIFLEVDDFNSNSMSNIYISNSFGNGVFTDNILDRITITSGMNTVVTINSDTRLPRYYFSPVKLVSLRIRLIDKYGETVDLNRNDISLVLEIEQLY